MPPTVTGRSACGRKCSSGMVHVSSNMAILATYLAWVSLTAPRDSRFTLTRASHLMSKEERRWRRWSATRRPGTTTAQPSKRVLPATARAHPRGKAAGLESFAITPMETREPAKNAQRSMTPRLVPAQTQRTPASTPAQTAASCRRRTPLAATSGSRRAAPTSRRARLTKPRRTKRNGKKTSQN